ncbi:WD40-like protein, partial [Ostertagia ostertagi]
TKINARKLTDDNSCTPKKCSSPEAEEDPILREQCEKSYVWDMYPTYDIFKVNEYGNIIAQLTDNDAYDAEAVISPDGKKILYTSKENGDLDIYIMDIDGTNKKQLTHELGLRWRRLLLTGQQENCLSCKSAEDRRRNRNVQISTRVDGQQFILTCPRLLQRFFSSNFNSTGPDDPDFNLYIVNEDGTGLEQVSTPLTSVKSNSFKSWFKVTFDGSHFDGFPMFSRDGKKLVWSSGRGSVSSHSQNVFIADWVDPGTSASDVSNGELERGGSKEELRTNRIPKKKEAQVSFCTYSVKNIYNISLLPMICKSLTFHCQFFFSYDDSKLTLQATGYGTACDQLNATTFKNIRNTCPAKKCANPATITDPVLKQLCNTSYTWDVFPDYDIFLVNKYGNIIKQLTDERGYDAEAVLSPDGKTIAFHIYSFRRSRVVYDEHGWHECQTGELQLQLVASKPNSRKTLDYP